MNKCPICTSREIEKRPEPISGKQDILFVCGNSIAFPVDNPSDIEETGVCENKIDWEHIYVDYGGEFDESAKIIDERFYGWIELEFYRDAHVINKWNNLTNCMDRQYLDKYFENKELYIKELRESSTNVSVSKIDILEPQNTVEPKPISPRLYFHEPLIGSYVVQQEKKFNKEDCEVTLFKVLRSNDRPELIGSYILEEVYGINDSRHKKNRITLYSKEIIDLIISDHSNSY